jgi:hypothetical protein
MAGAPLAGYPGSELGDGDDHPGQDEHDDQGLCDEPEARHRR